MGVRRRTRAEEAPGQVGADLIRDAADTDVLVGLMVAATVAGLVRVCPGSAVRSPR